MNAVSQVEALGAIDESRSIPRRGSPGQIFWQESGAHFCGCCDGSR